MNQRASLVLRAARDMVQRLRVMLGGTGDDAAIYVDHLTADVAEGVAGDVCATLGIEYEGADPRTETAQHGRKHPWGKRGQVRGSRGL